MKNIRLDFLNSKFCFDVLLIFISKTQSFVDYLLTLSIKVYKFIRCSYTKSKEENFFIPLSTWSPRDNILPFFGQHISLNVIVNMERALKERYNIY